MRIGELAAESGLSRDTLRFYEARGLIRAVCSGNGYRHYPAETMQTLFYIRTAQRLGFSLAEIGENLDRVADAPDPDQMVEALLLEKLATIDERVGSRRAPADLALATFRGAGSLCLARSRWIPPPAPQVLRHWSATN